ncbi:twin-arginine translocation signal domain-containing protein [Natronobeatus ordinarius]|uniref:twin-arginine translocation signal domain-containing protein n=1 Tax=Natronobeatus ordinarius TaxID=2963433 RepID=UPI0020CE841A|nr:twin-arginine translocation signal domain-containing protein [Natronobeatus ordinarius]
MDLSLTSRRNVLKAGAAVAGAGVVGGCVLNRSDLQGDDTPGAKGLTTGTVPGDINRLIQIDADVAFRDDAIERGTNALLNSAAFAEVPDTIAMTFDGESATGIDRRGVGKL